MATFPEIEEPMRWRNIRSTRRAQFQNQTVRFVDGSEQRYRDSAGARLEWEIQLSRLDEGELAAIEEFFLASQGAFGTFHFHRSVGWARSTTTAAWRRTNWHWQRLAEMRGSTKLTVVRNIVIPCWYIHNSEAGR